MDPTTASSNSAWWQYGAIGIIALVFALVIRHLYVSISAERKEMTKERIDFVIERSQWAIEREKIQTAQEAELRRIGDNYAVIARDDRRVAQEREDSIRQEFSDLMERVAAEAAKASAELGHVLDKIYDRFLGPRRH